MKHLPDDELAHTQQSFVEHLMELRRRLLYAVYGMAAVWAVLLLWPGPAKLYDYLAHPLVLALPQGSKMIAIGVVSPFLVPLKVSALVALALALPWVLYQVWAFVAPGLYKHERKLVWPLLFSSTALFYAGAAFCYFVVLAQAFPAILRMAPAAVAVSPDIEAYLDFIITLFIAFGVAFEVPVLLLVLVYCGWVHIEQLKAWRAYFVVAAAAVAAVVTPPDPISMLALLLPMCLLYEAGIWGARWLVKPAPSSTPSPE